MSADMKPRYDGLPERDFVQTPGLNMEERVSRHRWSPRGNPWARVAEYDRRVSELEQRRAAISAELRGLHERRNNAPADDAARLAEWEMADRRGRRPEPQAEALDAAISSAPTACWGS